MTLLNSPGRKDDVTRLNGGRAATDGVSATMHPRTVKVEASTSPSTATKTSTTKREIIRVSRASVLKEEGIIIDEQPATITPGVTAKYEDDTKGTNKNNTKRNPRKRGRSLPKASVNRDRGRDTTKPVSMTANTGSASSSSGTSHTRTSPGNSEVPSMIPKREQTTKVNASNSPTNSNDDDNDDEYRDRSLSPKKRRVKRQPPRRSPSRQPADPSASTTLKVEFQKISNQEIISNLLNSKTNDDIAENDSKVDRVVRRGLGSSYDAMRAVLAHSGDTYMPFAPLSVEEISNYLPTASEANFASYHADILASTTGLVPFGHGGPGVVIAELNFPGVSNPDLLVEFPLLVPRNGDNYDPAFDVVNTARFIIKNLIDSETSKTLFGVSTGRGILRILERYYHNATSIGLKIVISRFNDKISELKRSNYFDQPVIGPECVNTLNEMAAMARTCATGGRHPCRFGSVERYRLVSHILEQSYERTISQRSRLLVKYETFSNNVYGEVKSNFVKRIVEESKLGPGMVFLDMGSGVGNVALQVAAQCGCEAYGIEIMDNPAGLAVDYLKEFAARLKAYSLNTGTTTLIHGDFLLDPTVQNLMHRVDVIFLNNYIFTADLTQQILAKFLDLREGCKVVTLKSLVPVDRRANARNINAMENIFTMRECRYGDDCVSWASAGGTFYLHKVDRRTAQRRANAVEERETPTRRPRPTK